jgi:hypothetical protein
MQRDNGEWIMHGLFQGVDNVTHASTSQKQFISDYKKDSDITKEVIMPSSELRWNRAMDQSVCICTPISKKRLMSTKV